MLDKSFVFLLEPFGELSQPLDAPVHFWRGLFGSIALSLLGWILRTKKHFLSIFLVQSTRKGSI